MLAKNREAKNNGFSKETRKEIKITEKICDRYLLGNQLLALGNHLAFHGNTHCKDITKIIIDEITHTHKEYVKCKFQKNDLDNIRCFRMLLVSRHTAGGFYSLENGESDYMTDKDRLNPVSLLTGNTYWLWTKSKKKEQAAKIIAVAQ